MKLKRKLMKLKKTSSILSEMKLLKSKRNLMPLISRLMNLKPISKLIFHTTMMKTWVLLISLKIMKKLMSIM